VKAIDAVIDFNMTFSFFLVSRTCAHATIAGNAINHPLLGSWLSIEGQQGYESLYSWMM